MTVAYRDGRAYWNKKNYPAGIFATNLLNVFYKNDTAARISVFSDEINHNILKQLRCGYLNIRKKELSENNPIMDIYNKRCSCIRTEALRGTITPVFAEKAKVMAKNRKQIRNDN